MSDLTRRIAKIERALEPNGPEGEVTILVVDTPEARAEYGIEHRDPWVPPFTVVLSKEEARARGARRANILFVSEAEARL